MQFWIVGAKEKAQAPDRFIILPSHDLLTRTVIPAGIAHRSVVKYLDCHAFEITNQPQPHRELPGELRLDLADLLIPQR